MEIHFLNYWDKNPHVFCSEKMTERNSKQHQTTTKKQSAPISCSLQYRSKCNLHLCGSHRADAHEMDHATVLDSELNGHLCRSALWSLLITSRWSSSIFKTLLSTREADIMKSLSLALMKYHLADWRENLREEVRRTARPTVVKRWEKHWKILMT